MDSFARKLLQAERKAKDPLLKQALREERRRFEKLLQRPKFQPTTELWRREQPPDLSPQEEEALADLIRSGNAPKKAS